jgi:hypothetical protein
MPKFKWPPDSKSYQAVMRKFGKRKCRLFSVAWCRKHIKKIKHPDCVALIDMAELYADGLVPRLQIQRLRRAVNRWAEAETESGPTGSWIARWAVWNAAQEAIAPPCVGYLNYDRKYGIVAGEVFGNPAAPVVFSPEWRTDTAVALARQMYEAREFSAMPILADALQDAGCDNTDMLSHCRDTKQLHVRGCWMVDLVMGKG